MSAEEHRDEAVKHRAIALREEGQFDPKAVAAQPDRDSPWSDPKLYVPLVTYNPTEGHLTQAERNLRYAQEHTDAAHALERSEEVECQGIAPEGRSACPLLTPSLQRVEETPKGVRLVLRPGVQGEGLVTRMRCHLAYARTRAFESMPSCPLFLRGVTASLIQSGTVIELSGSTPEIAAALRADARALFAPGMKSESAPQRK